MYEDLAEEAKEPMTGGASWGWLDRLPQSQDNWQITLVLVLRYLLLPSKQRLRKTCIPKQVFKASYYSLLVVLNTASGHQINVTDFVENIQTLFLSTNPWFK
jgi:hypothetical protein